MVKKADKPEPLPPYTFTVTRVDDVGRTVDEWVVDGDTLAASSDTPAGEQHAFFVDHLVANEAASYGLTVDEIPAWVLLEMRGMANLRALIAGVTGRQRRNRGGQVLELEGWTSVFQGLDAGVLRAASINHQEALWVRHSKVTAELPFHVNVIAYAPVDARRVIDFQEVDYLREAELYDCPLYVTHRLDRGGGPGLTEPVEQVAA